MGACLHSFGSDQDHVLQAFVSALLKLSTAKIYVISQKATVLMTF
jgi:hypothetical protein